METVAVGTRIRSQVKFFQLIDNNTPADPTAVAVEVTDPSGMPVQVSWLQDSVGVYYVDVIPTHVGVYTVTWIGTGAVQVTTHRQFRVCA